MDSISASGITSAQKDELMETLSTQIAVANAEALLSKMTQKCFNKCISKPGSSLDSSEQKCVLMCMDRYSDTWNHVSRTYSKRIMAERDKS